MRAVKSVSIDSERRVIITYLDGSTETLYPNCIWCDSEALRQLIKDLLEEKADAITQAIENVTVATFADGADEGMIKKLLVSIDPIQEGTGDPSPENIRPISGRTGLSVVRTGKNIRGGSGMVESAKAIKESTGASRPIIDETANTITFNAVLDSNRQLFTAKFKENTVYTLILTYSKNSSTLHSNITVHYSDNSSAWIPPLPSTVEVNEKGTVLLTTASGKTIKDISVGNQGGTTTLYCNESGIFEGVLTSDDFEPYKGDTYSVNWETEAGTVYGGNLDVVSGKLTVDRASYAVSGNENISYNSTYGYFNVLTPLSNCIESVRGGRAGICSHYPVSNEITTNTMYANYDALVTYANLIVTSTLGRWQIRDSRFTTVEEFKTYLSGQASGNNPVRLIYLIATPTEIQLTPQEITTLLGDNNIWADSGNILELEYTADTKLYIGEQQSGTSGTLGSNMHTITIPDLQPVSEKTLEDVEEAYKEEATDERGEE